MTRAKRTDRPSARRPGAACVARARRARRPKKRRRRRRPRKSSHSTAPDETPAPTRRRPRRAAAPPPATQLDRAKHRAAPAPSGDRAPKVERAERAGRHAVSREPSAGKAGGKSSGAKRAPRRKPKRGKKAPKPSALTPALPLSLSSSIAGVPAFFIESFRIPPFLLPIYQAAGTAYGVPWQLLAAINEVETDYGRDLNVSSAGAEGWMQFLPSSWATYGVDANGDGFKDPYNPADAIFAAARYLRAAGAATSLRGAVFSYNHSQAYVESVMLRAKLLGGTPSGLLGAITGLTEARFPVHAKAHFSDGFPTSPPAARSAAKSLPGTVIYSEANAPVIAVQDGEVVQIGDSPQLGRFVSLRDAYGNTYTYAKLAQRRPALPGAAAARRAGRRQERRQGAGTGRTAPDRPGERRHAGRLAAARRRRRGDRGAVARLRSALEATGSGLEPPRRRPAPDDRAARNRPRPAAGAAAPERRRHGDGALRRSARRRRANRRRPPATRRSGCSAMAPNDVYLHELHTGARVIAGHGARARGRRAKRRRRRRRTAHALPDQAGRRRRAADRPQADPRRLGAAGEQLGLPGQGPEPLPGDRSDRRPGAAGVKGTARSNRCWPTPTSTSTRAGARTSRPGRSTAACWRRSSSSPCRG